MLFRILHNEDTGDLSYLLGDADAREAVVVDPHSHDLPVWLALLNDCGLRLRWVLRTHHHDRQHPAELSRLNELGAPVVQGDACAQAQPAAEGTLLPFGNEFVRVLETPGHTPDCRSFVWRDRVFCGGLLAVDACVHQPHPADPAALWDSVTAKVFTLPDETLLFAGHERRARALSTVLEQRRWHPFFAATTRDAYLARVKNLPRHSPATAVSAADTP